jgi:hypothetical protein
MTINMQRDIKGDLKMGILNKKILLVKPDYNFYPVGMAYVAASLVQNDIEFDFIDAYATSDSDLAGLLKSDSYGTVASGGLIGSFTFLKQLFT